MSTIARPALLKHLQSLIPTSANVSHVHNPWYIAAVVAYSGSNRADAVPAVFEHVMRDAHSHADRLLVARKFRDCLFKSGLTTGYPRVMSKFLIILVLTHQPGLGKAINSLIALHEVMPEDLRDTKPLRSTSRPTQSYDDAGKALFASIYGETAASVQGTLDAIYPDMGYFSNVIGYGFTYGFSDVLTPLETSYTLVSALISGDTPRQAKWHLDGALRLGASVEELKAVRQITMEVSKEAGIVFREEVPEVDEDLLQRV